MWSYFAEALSVMLANRMRSVLTMVGLIVGVAAIVAVQVVAAGMSGAVSGIFKNMHANTFYVFPKSTQSNAIRAGFHPPDLTMLSQLPGIVTAIPWSGTGAMAYVGHHRVRIKFGGESDKRFTTAPIVAGRALSPDDMSRASSACVISDRAYQRLFPDAVSPTSVLGRSVDVGAHRYVIVGVLGKATIDTAALGLDISNDVAIPYTTYYNAYQRGSAFFAVQVLGDDKSKLSVLEQEATVALSHTHAGAQYETFDLGYFTKTISAFLAVVGVIVSAVGAISLVVAGIGIMNIMLVSVTERTHEIGIRKAIGAKRSQVLAQFFIESLLLSLFGCLIGLVFGLALGAIVDAAFIAKITGVAGAVPWLEAVLIAVSFATIVTVVFGTYPAYRAARLDPIEALRYE